MIKETFEDYLKSVHNELFPALLDDDLSDHYDDWIGSLDTDDLIQYANQAIQMVKERRPLNGIPF